jgi:hypothetical protein
VLAIGFGDRFEHQETPLIQDDKFIIGVCIFTAGDGDSLGGWKENTIQCTIVYSAIAKSSERF